MRWPPRKQHNFVCTHCRRSIRRHANSLGRGEIRCATCGDLCEEIEGKRPVPKRSDVKAWKQLQDDLDPPRAKRIAELERQLAAWQLTNGDTEAFHRAALERELEMLHKLHTRSAGPQPSPAYRPPTRRGADRAERAEATTQGPDDT